jgi:hypothetical protein
MKSTNYFDTFITVSADCPPATGTEPASATSVAGLQYRLLRDGPYILSSDDLLFEVYAYRNGIVERDREKARGAFFSKPQACLRASPLVKRFGWGLHHDEAGRLAVYGVETEEYRKLVARADLKVVPGMRSRRT